MKRIATVGLIGLLGLLSQNGIAYAADKDKAYAPKGAATLTCEGMSKINPNSTDAALVVGWRELAPRFGPAPAAQSYLCGARIVEVPVPLVDLPDQAHPARGVTIREPPHRLIERIDRVPPLHDVPLCVLEDLPRALAAADAPLEAEPES